MRIPKFSRNLTTATTKPTTGSTALPPLALRVSTLSNGIRVATDPTPGHFVAAGVYVDAGSRYEGERTRGAGHMVDRMGFKVSHNTVTHQLRRMMNLFFENPSIFVDDSLIP